jgi:cytoskeletal protein CcmA (bactofilin family)
MSATSDRLPEANKLLIGEGVVIKGAVLTADAVVVHGMLEGDISVTNLVISEKGTIKGRTSVAQNAEIFGRVFDRLDVKGLLILRASARVDGNVSCGILQIEQGAAVTGAILSNDYRAEQTFKPALKDHSRAGNGTSALLRLDLSTLELAPSPIPAIS